MKEKSWGKKRLNKGMLAFMLGLIVCVISMAFLMYFYNIFYEQYSLLVTLLTIVLVFGLIWMIFQYRILIDKNRKLALNETLYRNLFEQIPIGITLNECYQNVPKYHAENINPAAQKLFEKISYEVAEKEWTKVTHPDDLQ